MKSWISDLGKAEIGLGKKKKKRKKGKKEKKEKKEKKISRKKDYPCLVCDVHVKKNDAAIQCNLCDLWVHQKCAKISDALFKELVYQAENNGGATWSCKSCRCASAKLNKQLTEVYKRVETLEAGKKDQDLEIKVSRKVLLF